MAQETSIPKARRRFNRWWLLAIIPLALITVGVVIVIAWASTPTGGVLPDAQQALESDSSVTVSDLDGWYTFMPAQDSATTGFIFYPGGKVLPAAYATVARAIAEAGYPSFVVKMPLNLAVIAPNKADEVMAAHPEITRWVIGGHSLGGSMAATYANGHPDAVQGLVLMASYPAAYDDLSTRESLIVASIYGTNDGLAKVESVLGAEPLLPESAQFVEIVGGNHSYFGSYGDQPGDGVATLTREEQQAQIVESTLAILAAVSE